MIKKIVYFLLVFLLFLSLATPVLAKENCSNVIYFFWAEGCPHCEKEMKFLEGLKQKYENIEIKSFETSENYENLQLLLTKQKEINAPLGGTPFTIIGNHYFSGYLSDEVTGQQIAQVLDCNKDSKKEIPEVISIPLIGRIEIKNLSLPLLATIIGVLDGFNPCAMWTLLFLISMLLGMKDKKKMWILGTIFIVSSAFVYFLFMTAWLNFFLFLGFVFWVRIVIGLVALVTGSYNVREYFVNKQAGCKVTGNKKRLVVFDNIRKVIRSKEFFLAIVGMILLAFAVNLVELVCSAGFPAIFTQVLSLTKLKTWQYYLYLLIYIFFFMIDDLIVFFTAMITFKMVGVEKKYTRFSFLIGGLLMLVIGVLIIFKPEVLMFG